MKIKRAYDDKEMVLIDYDKKGAGIDINAITNAGIKLKTVDGEVKIDINSLTTANEQLVTLPYNASPKTYVVYPTTSDEQLMLMTSEQLESDFNFSLGFDDLVKLGIF